MTKLESKIAKDIKDLQEQLDWAFKVEVDNYLEYDYCVYFEVTLGEYNKDAWFFRIEYQYNKTLSSKLMFISENDCSKMTEIKSMEDIFDWVHKKLEESIRIHKGKMDNLLNIKKKVPKKELVL